MADATAPRPGAEPAADPGDEAAAPAGWASGGPHRRVVVAVAVGSVASLGVFALVSLGLRSLAGVDRHWLPWAVLGIALAATMTVAGQLVHSVGRSREVADVARDRGRQLWAYHGRTQEVLAQVRDAVVVTDGGGTVVEFNEAAEHLLDRGAGRAVGRPCRAVLGLRASGRELDCREGCGVLARFPPEDVRGGVELLRDRPDGTDQPLLVTVGTVPAADGGSGEVVHSLRDITRLRRADEAKTMFLATACHELKTPLTVIGGFVETLGRDDLDAETRELARSRIQARLAALDRIVEGFLQASRMERGRLRLELRRDDVVSLVAERVDSFAETHDRRVELTGDPVATAVHDPEALRTVVDHLLENAIKYSPDGGPVEVDVGAGEGTVGLAVSDRGIGMDPETRERCFDRFWQCEQHDARRFRGTGIGLYLVRALVEAMGGSVTVDSRLGEGSTFTVRLPCRVPEPTAVSEPAGRVSPPALHDGSLVEGLLRHTGVGAGRAVGGRR